MSEEPQVRTRTRPAADAAAQAANSTAMTQNTETTKPAGTLARTPRGLAGGAAPLNEDTSWMKTGDAGAAAAEAERKARAARDAEMVDKPTMPWRFKLDWKANNGQGESADIIILDTQPGPRFYEHRVRDPRTGYWNNFEQCPHEWDNCPLCPPQGEKAPYYVMMLTVIDMRPFEDRDGVTHVAAQRLLPVKLEQQGTFDALYKQHGTLRGMHLIMTRDGGKMSPEIGNNIVFDSIHPEEELIEYAKVNGLWEERKTDKGRVVWSEGGFIQPVRYGLLFEKPSGAKLRAKYGGENPIGGQSETSGEGWRNGTNPGRAAGVLSRQGSTRRVNLSEEINDEIPDHDAGDDSSAPF